ncbi:nitrogenase molybdenum-iron protein subunit beta [Serpentinicella alkaliphila]|uniref:Nitrogenase molybdenum-iron protein beta chain n=1 Tax=Serpentinicella alkaliphila TaxID=1734049 RepID=A0A4R2U153_9FIRM|nr:nitrogenase molybdenum-iron protein subunit beta [Serpentinicella alkaliphila]QUH24745.1 nitrogenase molybdenum-iron protein subunit beta [Serpentinicella alkaliphila]TCQ03739.1 Mo-nitrogenase MoFe protein subunit NifK [Serpentinicella alkaliphila]
MLNHTPKEIYEKRGLVINPAKTCQPIGAMYAALGIHGCLPHSHGSQGCCSYHRMHLTRHFRDPIVASTSSFTEGSSVFGGLSNLKTAINNVFSIYKPEVIAINTTYLSETIGDDIGSIIQDAEIPEGKVVLHANTPSYVGSHITGFSNMVKAMVTYLAKSEKGISNGKVNIIPGFVNPGDMREIKRIAKLLEVPITMFPDTSGVVDSPMTGKYEMYPKGGAKVEEITDSGNSDLTIALGRFASEAGAFELEKKCKVKPSILKTPIGIEATDKLIMELVKATGVDVPYELEEERGQLVDIMTDTHYHYHGKRVAIFGDPDTVIALTEFVLGIGMKPIHVLTGTPGQSFEIEIKEMLEEAGVEGRVKSGGDLFEFHQWIKNEPVDLIIGNTYGKFISKAEDIPLVRIGFPVLDRSVHSYLPVVGYKGAMRVLEMISNALLDKVDIDSSDEDFELVL